jgi:hypothetical protein
MITASANYVLFEGSKTTYSALTIVCEYEFNPITQMFRVGIVPATITAGADLRYSNYPVELSKAAVDAKTGTGTNPSDKLGNQIDQVVADYLDAITENSAITFAVS